MPEPASLSPVQGAGRWGRRVDLLSVGLVLAFAMVASSFVARNSDLWLHLATGRLLATGQYRFGTDPFCYVTAGTYWANHAWLFDLFLYLAFTKLGGPWLVALKAVAVTVTAGLMLGAARQRGPGWITTGCVLLAVLAMTPRLLLQPAVVSLLLLSGCLCCLLAGGRWLRALPVLVVVWVNVDGWFVLGPALVGLFWLGRYLDPDRGSLPWPTWLFPATLGACLLSPHHVFALQLPAELSSTVQTSAFRSDPRFATVFASPWRWASLGAAGGYSPAAWSFVILFTLGVVSFVVNRRAVKSWRGAVWVVFAALGAWQVRLVPFFAVVAGPITALNLRDAWPNAVSARAGRWFVLAAAIALLGLGSQGWLTGSTTRERVVAWATSPDPTLAHVAEGAAQWAHTTGLPLPARVFATHPDVGHYLAWHAPGLQYFLDSRLTLFATVAEEFTTLSRAVGALPGGDGTEPPDVAAVILYDPDGLRMTRALEASFNSQLRPLRIDGAAILLAPRSSTSPGFDPERAAFGGVTDLPIAWTGPANLAEPLQWWQVRGARIGSWEADAATVYLRLAELRPSDSPALLLLAIRAGRLGVEVDPTDSTAWLTLGRAYVLLNERTWEREAGRGMIFLEQLRFIQATAAFTQATLLNPDLTPARENLARMFLRRNFLDLAHRHAAAASRLLHRTGPFPSETADSFVERTATADALTNSLLESVQDAQNRYLIRIAGLTSEPLARARIALALGLAQKAIDILLASHPDLYGPAGISLLAELLLQTGQIAECRTLLDRAELLRNPDVLGYHSFPRKANQDGSRWPYRLHARDWFDLCQCAAAGRYSGAREAIGRLTERMAEEELSVGPPLTRGFSALVAGEVGLGTPPTPVPARILGFPQHTAVTGLLVQAHSLPVTRADLMTLAGTFDLERGDVSAAATRFQTARGLYSVAHPVVSRPGEPLAVRYDQAIRTAR